MEYFNGREEIKKEEIEYISEGLLKGKTVVFPTETVYGIGANSFDKDACKKVFNIKERPKDKALIILISNYQMLKNIVKEPNELEKLLMKKFWPGPLTIIFNKSENCKISEEVTGGRNDIGIRMTSGKITKLLVENTGVPIVAPSANISGNPTGIKIENIIKEIGDRVDYILDCGDIEDSTPSTIVKVENNVIKVIREGKITINELKRLGKVEFI